LPVAELLPESDPKLPLRADLIEAFQMHGFGELLMVLSPPQLQRNTKDLGCIENLNAIAVNTHKPHDCGTSRPMMRVKALRYRFGTLISQSIVMRAISLPAEVFRL
jgi:hypothetical protein